MKSPYFSFLLCSHESGALINVYVNGMPMGTIRAGVFEPHGFIYPQGEPVLIRLNNLPKPFPFKTLGDMKAMLHEAIDKLSIIDGETEVGP